MAPKPDPLVHALEWIASSLKDLRSLPDGAQDEIGQAIYEAQRGGKHPSAKPLKGDAFRGAAVIEVVSDFGGDAFRAAYAAKFKGVIYVLHVFQKKSTRGIKTSQADIALIKRRLATATEQYKMNYRDQDTG